MTAIGIIGGDPAKLNKAGYSKGTIVAADTTGTLQGFPIGSSTNVLTVDLTKPEDIDWKVGGGGGGTSVKVASTVITSGNVTCTANLPYTQIAPDISVAAATNDWIGLTIEALLNDSGDTLIVDAATRSLAPADINYLSSGTGTPLYNGARPGWYNTLVGAGFNFPAITGEAIYRVQAADVVAGSITIRCYGAGDAGGGSGRIIIRSAAFPMRVTLKNYGQGT